MRGRREAAGLASGTRGADGRGHRDAGGGAAAWNAAPKASWAREIAAPGPGFCAVSLRTLTYGRAAQPAPHH